ncbi:MAG: CgeB family protein [Nitrososphaerales archaeon]
MTATLDLAKPFGATPAMWQLFKGFFEEGHEVLIIPYHGSSIDSIWWKSYQNPNYYKGVILEKLLSLSKSNSKLKNGGIIPALARAFSKPKLEKLIIDILTKEKGVEALLLIGVPLNQLTGLATSVKKICNIPVIYYDLDVPTSLPSAGGFTFNYYVGAVLDEYDSIIIPSEGCVQELKDLGARNVNVVHFGVDPDVYSPLSTDKDIDFFFFGNGGAARKKNVTMMITEPSRVLQKSTFIVSGRGMDIDVGNASIIPPLSFTEWRKYCCRSKINLNVVRELHASVYATSTSRPFELAALECCIVSAPYKGLEKWLEIGKEVFIANSSKECVELYEMLLDNTELRRKSGLAARDRVRREHTCRHRVREIVGIINGVT